MNGFTTEEDGLIIILLLVTGDITLWTTFCLTTLLVLIELLWITFYCEYSINCVFLDTVDDDWFSDKLA